MEIPKLNIGDIILEDSNHTGAKIVKFFMTAPTVWHHIFRAIKGTQEKVEYYHVAMPINDGFNGATGQADIIEQQAKVRLDDWNPNVKQIVFRPWYLAYYCDRRRLKDVALKEIGKGYDILNCFGKFLTWLTGIKFFARYVESPNKEICVNRVCSWYKSVLGADFGFKTHSEITTHTLYKHLINNDEYEVVYKKD